MRLVNHLDGDAMNVEQWIMRMNSLWAGFATALAPTNVTAFVCESKHTVGSR